jgi:hypothetical protein
MWNSYTDTSAWRGVNDYQRAFERWQKAPQWRGDEKSDFTPRKVERNSSKREWTRRGTGTAELTYVFIDRTRWPELLNIRTFYPDADERLLCYGRPVTSRYSRDPRPNFGSGGWEKVPPLTLPERSARQAGRIIEAMRLALYKAHDCIVTETLPHYQSWSHLRTVAEANRKLS